MKGFLIAGTNSGCGKTTVTIGLMELLKSMGKNVAPFKTGPDYIDPLFHSAVLETPSYNLDTVILPQTTVKYLFNKHCKNKDIAVVEGVMGMYDGMGETSRGSSYELSQTLNLPIVLVVNCKGLYQSVAAIVKGFMSLKPNSNIKGVILNHVPNNNYYQFLKTIVERECDVVCLGYVPKNEEFALESRHLGLIQAEEVNQLPSMVQNLTGVLSETIDIDKLLNISNFEPEDYNDIEFPKLDLSDLHIGIAYDKAFRFYYKDNLELLEELGARISYFSPLKSTELPPECNCLYIGGGYPEVFSRELSENEVLCADIKKAILNGMPTYAECGGLMYLCQDIINADGEQQKMAGVFNASVQMTSRLQRFGYANLNYGGVETKCHEFHRSQIVSDEGNINYDLKYELNKPGKQQEWKCGLKHNNCLAGYAHVHFYSNFQFFKQIVELWRAKTT